MILKKLIQLEFKKTIHIQVNYIDLPKRYLFVITTIYSIIIYIVLNNNIPKIAILTNPTKKRLELNKNIQLETIHKYTDTVYIITDIIKAFIIITTIFSILSDPFSTIQKKTIFNN